VSGTRVGGEAGWRVGGGVVKMQLWRARRRRRISWAWRASRRSAGLAIDTSTSTRCNACGVPTHTARSSHHHKSSNKVYKDCSASDNGTRALHDSPGAHPHYHAPAMVMLADEPSTRSRSHCTTKITFMLLPHCNVVNSTPTRSPPQLQCCGNSSSSTRKDLA